MKEILKTTFIIMGFALCLIVMALGVSYIVYSIGLLENDFLKGFLTFVWFFVLCFCMALGIKLADKN